ncbi:MAG: thioredoxin family protein [Phycisphaerae bacterium]|nr:thioredoxin family protein [Phycisphaerae bacterium]MBG83201.1 thioredoxin family protein [Phycisphaerae bacterium]
MARTPSTMQPLGTRASDFTLPDGLGVRHSLQSVRGEQGLLVIFMCNHCPFVVHIAEELARLGEDYPSRGIGIVAISSNDVENYPQDGPEKMAATAAEWGLTYPYLYDETQDVARAYDAACTPDFFVFNKDLELVYRGQLDDSRPESGIPVDGRDLRSAMDALLAGTPIDPAQKPSLGCNIKWKS